MTDPLENMEFIADTREKERHNSQYLFRDQYIVHRGRRIKVFNAVPVVRKCLKYGDYSLSGFESQVGVERKTKADFESSLTGGRLESQGTNLFEKIPYRVIAIEASYSDMWIPDDERLLNFKCAPGAICSLVIDGVPVMMCGDRRHAELFTHAFLMKAYKRLALGKEGSLIKPERRE